MFYCVNLLSYHLLQFLDIVPDKHQIQLLADKYALHYILLQILISVLVSLAGTLVFALTLLKVTAVSACQAIQENSARLVNVLLCRSVILSVIISPTEI